MESGINKSGPDISDSSIKLHGRQHSWLQIKTPFSNHRHRLHSDFTKSESNIWRLKIWIPNQTSSISHKPKSHFKNLQGFDSWIINRTLSISDESEPKYHSSRIRLSNPNRIPLKIWVRSQLLKYLHISEFSLHITGTHLWIHFGSPSRNQQPLKV